MIYLIVLLILIINFILDMSKESFIYVLFYLFLFKTLTYIFTNKCDPDNCPFYKHKENYDCYYRVEENDDNK